MLKKPVAAPYLSRRLSLPVPEKIEVYGPGIQQRFFDIDAAERYRGDLNRAYRAGLASAPPPDTFREDALRTAVIDLVKAIEAPYPQTSRAYTSAKTYLGTP